MLSITNEEKIRSRQKLTLSLILVFLMMSSTTLSLVQDFSSEDASPSYTFVTGELLDKDEVEPGQQPSGQGSLANINDHLPPQPHPAIHDIMWADSGVSSGVINDLSAIAALSQTYSIFLEESNKEDHDNDGINDLDDLDDDNDGIYDLLERFDGCYGTDPLDHDNDGVLDVDDWDDDNDGILEGPLDIAALEALGLDPLNVTTDRYLDSSIIHPWTNTQIGVGYLADQNPMDHDNDGVTDEDSDGSGADRYDEDDDNDGRIDQFSWPCDLDGDGVRDYFDDDDDGDGVPDVEDEHPYDSSLTGSMQANAEFYDAPRVWQPNEYLVYSGGVDYVIWEANRVNAATATASGFYPLFEDATITSQGTPSFTQIIDGDLDGDGIPNFLDPDNDNDGIPDSSDTDDDNDTILDMSDPDDDNDGIPDVCVVIDNNGDGLNDYTRANDSGSYQTPGADTDGVAGLDCEIDYDSDLDDDRLRPFDLNYNAIYDWLDSDMGGTTSPDNLGDISVSGDQSNFEYDLDNDQIENENDSFPLDTTTDVASWNCPTQANPIPTNPDPRCITRRASFSQFNDWDGDGILNWDDIDDDNDGIIDILDIDWDCDFDNDADLHAINGALYRDDGPNNIDSDVDGDGLENSIDWDDDNDGLSDLYDPDDGNCGVVDFDQNDGFYTPYYPITDGGDLDGSDDGQGYSDNFSDYWKMVFQHNPFENMMLNYNGYDGSTQPATPGVVPEFYWFLLSRWSSRNGGNEWDIDTDGDSLINGLDIDQDGDGLPDWWDQDEGNDGILDIDDPKLGGTFNLSTCGWTAGNFKSGYSCGYVYAFAYQMPLNGVNAQLGLPFSTRPDPGLDQGATAGGPSNNWSCTPGAQGGCWHYDYGNDGTVDAGITYIQMQNNRDAYNVWMGLSLSVSGWNWNSDNGPVQDFPDELGADIIQNDVDPDMDGDGYNNTIDIDDDADGVYDWYDIDDDNDGLWDYFEVDSNDDLDDDASINMPPGSSFFTGTNCEDNDDDGNDDDADDDGFFQAVWDRGEMTQGYQNPKFYDVDNDNDGVPDGEDYDDDNNGIDDWSQELLPGCFVGEEGSTWDHDNDNITDWNDDDWDADGLNNTAEINANGLTAAFDHDNDGLRDDIDKDDDQDGMEDIDEILVWPIRFDRNSTNPWDHDDFGDGEALANPLDDSVGPDAIDTDDDNDTLEDIDFDHLEENEVSFPCYNGAQSSDWDFDNDCVLDEDDKSPTFITLDAPSTLWIDAQTPQRFTGHVDWVNPVTLVYEPAPNVPIQINIEWANNGTTAIESIYVPTNNFGNFSYNQYIYPEMLTVGDSTTYKVYAEVTELFAFNGNRSQEYLVGVEANLTANIAPMGAFKSSEQPFKIDFWAHYTADTQRGDYTKLINYVPITFTVRGGPFGNISSPTNFTGLDGNGYRTDNRGFASVTFVQDVGINGTWKQIRRNASLDNGVGQLPGGYEEIIWDDLNKKHVIVTDANTGDPITGNFTSLYSNTTLPAGDYQVVGSVRPEIASEWPFPYMHGDDTEPENVRVMHRMNIYGSMLVPGTNPVYYWDSTINNNNGFFGNWATLFHSQALTNAGLDFNTVSATKPYPTNWDGNLSNLTGEAAKLRPFIVTSGDDWLIALVNGGETNLPPCGKVDPFDADSETRCEIVPEMNTGETLRMTGSVTNRTNDPWDADPIALQVDIDGNKQFIGTGETQFTAPPKKACSTCDAVYDYNFTWEPLNYPAKTYGMRVDFTNSANYFTGNTSTLSPTGAYINVSVIGTTQFQMTSIPRLYRNTTNLVQAKLLDNSNQAVANAPVNYTWSFDGRTGINYTDDRGFFEIPFEINGSDALGNFTLQFEFPGSSRLKGSTISQSIWVISRTNITVATTSDNLRQSGDNWDFTALITDDGASGTTPTNLNGATSPNGGLVDVIFEGTDFTGVAYRQVIATIAPSAGFLTLPSQQPDNSHLCYYDGNDDGFADRDTDKNGLSREESIGCLKANISPLNPSLLRNDPAGFLPDGFGPVNVILRFEENLPNEGCALLDPNTNIRTLGGSWDPCSSIPYSEQYRVLMTNNANGFSLIGRTTLIVDDQIVYTSEVNPATGQVEEKDMEVTGQLQDELGTNLSNRKVRVQYEMINGNSGVQGCQEGYTDINGYFAIDCELSGVIAGKARVTVTYSAWDNENNDRYRYSNKTLQTEFEVFSNSTIAISEVGPFKSTEDKYVAPNGTEYYRLFLKESFHIDARLTQTNGQWVGGKCLNIYLDPESNVRPIATIRTSNVDGTIEWFSGDPLQNPTLKGVETTGGKTEGYRILRVAFEPDANVPGGCDKDASSALNGSFTDVNILVRSRVDLQVKQTWSYIGDNGLFEGDIVIGEVALLRDRLDLAVENEEVIFLRQYFDNGSWVTDGDNKSKTNEQGVARFEWAFDGRSCGGKDCDGRWRIIAYYPGSTFFAPSDDNITHEIQWSEPVSLSSSAGFFTPGNTMALVILLMALVIGGALYYQRAQARRQVQALRGILTDTMLQLEASNEFIAAIFDCYKNLVRHFRKYGFMKKVYETTREFEAAVRTAFNMVPSEQLAGFLTIFEEARYSDHTIDASHRDRALQTLDVIVRTLTMSLGEGVLVKRFEDVHLYDNQVKAGEFVAADGTVRQAGIVEGEGTDFKI
ncbi:MAG: DUF4129 domain-containing protein [Candidatus Poseidoniaceae archaeon]|nr:DUF4129 domain-containing protein [Candidatus Poseidoniaceae archaeon]